MNIVSGLFNVLTSRLHTLSPKLAKQICLTLLIGILSQQTMAQKINFNTADMQTLQSIPGIGESKARSIIEYRQQVGSFSSNEQLKEVSGIGDSIYKQIIQYGDINPQINQEQNNKTNTKG